MIYNLKDKNRACHVCNIAEGRVFKNMDIKWTKSAYKKYKRYTAVAILHFLKNNKYTKIFFIKYLPWSRTNRCFECLLPYKDISEYKKLYADYSLVRQKTFPIDYNYKDYNYKNNINGLQKFIKYNEVPMRVVSMADFEILINNIRADVFALYDMLHSN